MPKIRPIGILSIIIIAALALASACSLPDGRKPAYATYTSVIDSLSAKNPLSDGVHISILIVFIQSKQMKTSVFHTKYALLMCRVSMRLSQMFFPIR